MRNSMHAWWLVVLIISGIAPQVATAHDPATAELAIDWAGQRLRVELDMLDLDFVIALDTDHDRQISAGEIYANASRITRYIHDRLHIDACDISTVAAPVGIRVGVQKRVVSDFQLRCGPDRATIKLDSQLFDEIAAYRTVLSLPGDNGQRLHVLNQGSIEVPISNVDRRAEFTSFVTEGVHHILTGIDHLTFLLLLILPMLGGGTFRQRFISIAKIVTAFTIAHSITLSLSSLGQWSLPAKPVELLIAASVIFVALVNLTGRVKPIAWPIAYTFGLIHGFGFAGAFKDLASGSALHWSDILAFNLGVELGQLAVIIAAMLLLRPLASAYRSGRLLVPAGSLVAGVVGVVWIIQRL